MDTNSFIPLVRAADARLLRTRELGEGAGEPLDPTWPAELTPEPLIDRLLVALHQELINVLRENAREYTR